MYAALLYGMTDGLAELRAKLGNLPDGPCLIGLSGGADSSALIRMMAAERESGGIVPEAVHVNHGLRGEESDGDEAFCAELCESLRVPLTVMHADLKGRKDENACREERFRCFLDVMRAKGIRNLVLAHNRDDLAETFLMRLLRGAGTEGLACMGGQEERDGYVLYRPMLRIGRAEIRDAMRRDGWTWREDSSNQRREYLRNDIRLRLLPIMEEMAPGVSGGIAVTAGILTEENRMLQDEAEGFLRRHSGPRRIDANALLEVPASMRARILRAWWKRNAPELREHALNARQTKELSTLADTGHGKVNLPGNLMAVRGRRTIHLVGFPRETLREVPYRTGELCFGGIRLKTLPSGNDPGDGVLTQEIPEGFAEGCTIRTRKPGDRIRPFGMQGSRKLQDYLTDRGIDEPWRDEIPLLCRGNEVLLAAGVGAGAVPIWNPRIRNIRLQWDGEIPWHRPEKEGGRNG